jgi:glycosyltransferase involved in cell wall biosynthesis
MDMKNQKVKILFLVTEDWYFWSHRLPLARAARDEGFEVIVATHVRDYGGRIIQEGFSLIPIKLRRLNRNPLRQIISIIELIKIYRAERPDIVHQVAIKAVVFGTLAAKAARIPAVINALAGMGYVFSSSQTRAKVLKPLIRAAFRLILNVRNGGVIIQNPDDLELLVKSNIMKRENAYLIKGSGVDPNRFFMTPEMPGEPLIILASRMLRDKGIYEFVEAARKLLVTGVKGRFVLIGKVDSDNPASIPVAQLKEWHVEGIVEWWGYREDMPAIFSQAHIVCLPSFYGEGVPKVLIEAASCGRAIVTTDTPGCREIVRDGENGFLVPPHDDKALAQAIRRLIDNPSLREKMGERGREIAIREFSLDRVISETMALYRDLLPKKARH